MNEEDFKIQAYRIIDMPTYITYSILKILQSNDRIFTTMKTLFNIGYENTPDWFLEICIVTNMTLHDLIGHVKRAGDSGEIKAKLQTVVDIIRNSYMFQLEKRIKAIENKVQHITIS